MASVVHELEHALVGSRIDKITQPERDEIVLSIRGNGINHKLLLTAHASAPRVHFTAQNKVSPLQAPLFCMVLRKHLNGGRILAVRQPDFERIVEFEVENRNEMGDTASKILLIEIMGKHSNIILKDKNQKILDAVKHVPPSMSTVRTVLPGLVYEKPPNKGKQNPLAAKELNHHTLPPGINIQSTLSGCFNGISPVMAGEIVARAEVHPDILTSNLTEKQFNQLNASFLAFVNKVQAGEFSPVLYTDETGKAVDITPWPFLLYSFLQTQPYTSPSLMLEDFYQRRDAVYRLTQKTTDLRKILTTLLERCQKKAFTHEKSLTETQDRDLLRIKGELLTAYLHKVERGVKVFGTENFYDENKPIRIDLDPTLTPAENAQRYFKQYNKQKRAAIALQEQITQNKNDREYLESVMVALLTSSGEEDITEIREELSGLGFIKKRPDKKRQKQRPSKPLHFVSSDGYDIYVGKNNTQNDQLTLRTAQNSDLWFHTKDIPGSHVILLTRGTLPPERTVTEAANLAAYFSRARDGGNVPVDYVIRKHVRKPAGAKPGFVIYDHHKTIHVTPKEPNL